MENQKPKIEVETLASDLANVVDRENQGSVIKEIIEEQEKHETEQEKQSPERQKNIIFATIGAILVLLAIVSIFIVFLFRKQIFSVPVLPQYVPLVFTDKTEFLEISGFKKEEIAQTVVNELKTTGVKSGGIEGIYLTDNKQVVGLRKFLTLTESDIDQKKIEFLNDNFLIGISNNDKLSIQLGKNLFFLMKMRSMTDIFESMRSWENKMFFDLHQFFGIDLNVDNKYLLEKDFEDGIIQNKNARILYDKEGKVVLAYIYVEDDSLIITNSENTVQELIHRLASSRVKK